MTQPLDKGCFGPLKSAWRKACHDFLAQNPGKVVSRYSFCSVFAIAWLQAMSIKNILAGFKVTGTFPIDRNKLIPCDSSAPSLLQSVDPAYIPMLGSTPSKKISTPNPIVFSDSEHELSSNIKMTSVMKSIIMVKKRKVDTCYGKTCILHINLHVMKVQKNLSCQYPACVLQFVHPRKQQNHVQT